MFFSGSILCCCGISVSICLMCVCVCVCVCARARVCNETEQKSFPMVSDISAWSTRGKRWKPNHRGVGSCS